MEQWAFRVAYHTIMRVLNETVCTRAQLHVDRVSYVGLGARRPCHGFSFFCFFVFALAWSGFNRIERWS